MYKKNILPKMAMLGMAVLLVILAWGWLFSNIASSQLSQSNTTPTEIYQIESRLNQLELQLDQLRSPQSPGAVTTPLPPSIPGRTRRQRPQLEAREKMFDRLATLAIELKERINKLETRVSKLESRKGAGGAKSY